ncbi:MAG: hypothetical protein CL678_09080, partial [Bdellovibrionaceae bacterium]|nr:hypothetical protein [Pseudobdellovibrionaceae bacterium]
LSVFLGLILWIPFGKVTYAMVSGFSSSSASRGRSNNFGQIPLILLLSLFAVVSYFSDEIIQWTSSSMPMILW